MMQNFNYLECGKHLTVKNLYIQKHNEGMEYTFKYLLSNSETKYNSLKSSRQLNIIDPNQQSILALTTVVENLLKNSQANSNKNQNNNRYDKDCKGSHQKYAY